MTSGSISNISSQRKMQGLKTIYLFVVLLSLIKSSSSSFTKPAKCDYYAGERVKDLKLRGLKCRDADLMEIPSYFPGNINYLDIEIDEIDNLTAMSFDPYPDLQYLTLRRVGLAFIEENTFSSLVRLLHLDLSRNRFSDFPSLPPSLETLMVDSMKEGLLYAPRTEDKLRRSRNLKNLFIRKNRLSRLPVYIPEMYGLIDLRLDGNKISRVSILDFSSLCNLKWFGFDGNQISSTEEDVCQCRLVQSWATEKKIQMMNFSCPETPNLNENKCLVVVNQSAELARAEESFQQCRVMSQRGTLYMYCVVPAALILAAVVLYFAYRKLAAYRGKAIERKKTPEEEIALDIVGT